MEKKIEWSSVYFKLKDYYVFLCDFNKGYYWLAKIFKSSILVFLLSLKPFTSLKSTSFLVFVFLHFVNLSYTIYDNEC